MKIIALDTGFATQSPDTINTLINKANHLYKIGDFSKAIQIYNKIIKKTKQKDPNYLRALLQCARSLHMTGRFKDSLFLLKKGLQYADNNNNNFKGLFLGSLGDLYLSMGKKDEAIKCIEDSIDLLKESKNIHLQINILSNIGDLCSLLSYDNFFFQKGIEAYDRILLLFENLDNNQKLRAAIIINRLRLICSNKNYDNTISELELALKEVSEMENSYDKAKYLIALINISNNLWDKKIFNSNEIIPVILNAYSMAKNIKEISNNMTALSNLYGIMGRSYELDKKTKESKKITSKAIFYAKQGNFPHILYKWQWQMGRICLAEKKMKKAIKFYNLAIKTLDPIKINFINKNRSIRDVFDTQIKPVYMELSGIYLDMARCLNDQESKKNYLSSAWQTMDKLKFTKIQKYYNDECLKDINNTNKFDKSWNIAKIPDFTAVINPVIFNEFTILLLYLGDEILQKRVLVNSELLKETVISLRLNLQNWSDINDEHYKLYEWMISPVENILKQKKIKNIIVSTDEILGLIPFSVFYDGEKYLIEKYNVSNILSLNYNTNIKKKKKEKNNALLCGFSEERSVGELYFSELPGVKKELKKVKEIVGGKILLNENFTYDKLTIEYLNNNYNVLHFATHAIFGKNRDETYLLTFNKTINIDGLSNLLKISQAINNKLDLLVLSACQTALGDKSSALGIGGAAIKAGVNSVVASLWSADDRASIMLITEFYSQYSKDNITKTRALKMAQEKLLKNKYFSHPGFWSPFILIGNWM